MKKKPNVSEKSGGVSRREFGRCAAIAVAGGALAAAAPPTTARTLASAADSTLSVQEQAASGLSPQALAEVEAKLQHIFATYGDRLSEDQKKLMRRTVTSHVRMLEVIRPFSVANGDSSATVLRLFTDSDAISSGKES